MLKNKNVILKTLYKIISKRADYVIIGLSGGVDSTVAACICTKALGPENVYTYGLPYSHEDWVKYNFCSESLAENLKVHYKTIPIEDALAGYKDVIDLPLRTTPAANLKTRIRTNILYLMKDLKNDAFRKKGIVIGTSNLTEMFIGDHVVGGDALGDLFILGDLFKSEVYEIAQYFVSKGVIEQNHIDPIPSSGLFTNISTESQLGYNYYDIEDVIQDWFSFIAKPEEKDISELYRISDVHKFVLDSYFANRHKFQTANTVRLRYLI